MHVKAEKKNLAVAGALLMLPLIYIAIGFFFRNALGAYYLSSVDPEYSYLFNGLNLAQFNFKVWHVDHPGTPLQLIVATVIRVVHFFVGKEPLVESVLRNPELYLGAVHATLISINGVLLYTLGRVTYRASGKILSAVFLQLTPMVSFTLLSITMRVGIEQAIVICALLMLIFLIKFIYAINPSNTKYSLIFSAIVAFGVACKIIVAPIFFIPLFLLSGWRNKIIYTGATAIFFTLFIYPVIAYRFDYFTGWIQDLFMHTGKYGSGSSTIIDTNAFWSNLRTIFYRDTLYSSTVIAAVVGLIIYQIPNLKSKFRDKKKHQLLLGLTIAVILNVVIVAKHYMDYYLVTSLMLNVFIVYILLLLYGKEIKFKYRHPVFCAIILCFFYFRGNEAASFANKLFALKDQREKTQEFKSTMDTGRKMLIIPDFFGCAYQEFAITFGLYWGGPYFTKEYNSALQKIYKNSYVYNGWDKKFHDWKEKSFSITELLKENKQLYLYSIHSEITNSLMELNGGSIFYHVAQKKIFSNDKTGENIFEIENEDRLSDRGSTIYCDAEKTNNDKSFFVGTADVLFSLGKSQSDEIAHSGRFSIKLTKETEYGPNCKIGKLMVGDKLTISIWRHKSNNTASLVLSSKNVYIGESKSIKKEGDWEQIVIKLVVTPNLADEEFMVYVWNNVSLPAYFDDFEIVKNAP